MICVWITEDFAYGCKTVILTGISNLVPDGITRFPVVSRAPLQVRPTMSITFGHATVKRLECERAMAERLNHFRLGSI
jgi:hypothetical protein